MGGSWRRLGPLIGLALFVVALLYLWTELRALSPAQIGRTMQAMPLSHVGLAIALTLVNYAVLTGYDQLAFIYLNRHFPRWQIGLASFVGYAISNNLGFALLSGASARYRFYSRWGLTAQEISRLVIFYSGTFWLGLLVLGGWGLAVHPPAGLASIPGHQSAPVLGVLLLAIATSYGIGSIVGTGPVRAWGFTLPPLPAPRLVAGQFVLSIADWALAAAVLWVLLPGPTPFIEVMSAFLAAQFVGLISNVPGGLVVFESSLVALLPNVDRPQLLSVLLAYRVIYYLLPLALALIILLIDESYERRHVLRRWGTAVGSLTVSAAPTLAAVFTFGAGAVLLFSGSLPVQGERLHLLRTLLPLPVVELSHFVNSLVGLGLLLVSQALARRIDAAWTLSVAGLVLGIAVSLLKGLDYEEAIVLSLVLGVLLSARREFDRRARLFEHTSRLWLTSVLLVVLGSIALGAFALFSRVPYSDELWRLFQFRGDAPRFLRATVGVAVILLAAGLRMLLSPAVPPLVLPRKEELDEADRAIQSQRSSSSYLVYLGDKALLWNDDRSAFLMYSVQGRTWVALHDPVGPPEAAPGLIGRFLEMVDDTDGVPVFYEIRKDYLHRYADFGLAFAKAGEEAIVSLTNFSLEGGARKKMRFTYNKLEKDGATFRLIPAADVPGVMPELRTISDEWLTLKASSEKGFSLGFFDEDYLARFPVAVLEVGGRIEAFATVWPGPERVELSVDLMRHRVSAPKNAMEGLFIYLMLWGRAQGFAQFNLGMAPLSGLQASSLAPLWVKVASYLYRYGQPFYNFQGLRGFKEKFSPRWESIYLAYPGGLALPRVLADVSALIAGGYRGILLRR